MTEDEYKLHCDRLIVRINDEPLDFPSADSIIEHLVDGHAENKRVITAVLNNSKLKITTKQIDAAFRKRKAARDKAQQKAAADAASQQRAGDADSRLKQVCSYGHSGSHGEITERDFVRGFVTINYPEMDYGARFTSADDHLCEKYEVERDIVLTASDFRLNQEPHKLRLGLFKEALGELVSERRRARRDEIWETICGFSEGRVEETIRAAARRMFNHLFHDPLLAEAAVRHVLWAIKRKMQGLLIAEHHAVFLFGAQDAGKTKFWSYVKAVILDLCKNIDVADLTDPKQLDIFRYSLLDCDEIAKHEKAELSRFKKVVTGDFVSRRKYYTQEMEDVPINGVIVGTTNNPLKTLFQDTTGMRRFVELRVKGRKLVPNWKEEIEEFDWLGLWQSVDHLAQDPLTDFMDELREQQEGMRTQDRVEQFLDYFEYEPQHLVPRCWIDKSLSDPPMRAVYPAMKLFAAYREWEEEACGKGRGMVFATFQDKMKQFLDRDDQPYPNWQYGGSGRRCYYTLSKSADVVTLPTPYTDQQTA